MSHQRFVIYATPRAGAGYLKSILNQVPRVSCQGDVFQVSETEESIDQQLMDEEGASTTRGLCLSPFSSERVLNETLHDPEMKKIILQRDLCASYISYRQAVQSKRSSLRGDETEPIGGKKDDRYGCQAHFDLGEFEKFRRQVTDFHRHIKTVLGQTGQEPLELWYHGLCLGNQRSAVADFLGLEWPDLSPGKTTVRMSSLPVAQRVDNPDELKAYQERDASHRKPEVIPAAPDVHTMPNGVRLILNSSLISDPVRTSILQGMYEKQEAKILRRTLRKRDRYLEWGGGLGYLASCAALTRQCRSITVVEASPDVFSYMKEILRINQVNATALNRLVGTEAMDGKKGTLYLNRHFWANSMVPKRTGKRKAEVLLASGKRLIDEHRPTYLNCDIEGSEFEVFPELDLRSVRKILVEVHEVPAKGRTLASFVQLLEQKGFVHLPEASIDNVLFFRRKRWFDYLFKRKR